MTQYAIYDWSTTKKMWLLVGLRRPLQAARAAGQERERAGMRCALLPLEIHEDTPDRIAAREVATVDFPDDATDPDALKVLEYRGDD